MTRRSKSMQSKHKKQVLYRCARQLIDKNIMYFMMFVVFVKILKFVICCDFFPHSK
jgi:hypothetical protein